MFGAAWIAPASGPGVWLITRDRVRLFEGTRFVVDLAVPEAARGGSTGVVAQVVDRDGCVWVSSTGGVARWSDGAWAAMAEATQPGEGHPTSGIPIAVDSEGSLWAGGVTTDADTGLQRFDGTSWRITDAGDPPDGRVNDLAADPRGGIWALAWSTEDYARQAPPGVYRFDGSLWRQVNSAGYVGGLSVSGTGQVWAAVVPCGGGSGAGTCEGDTTVLARLQPDGAWLAGNTWTRVDAEGAGSDWWPIVAYDPDRQQVLAWEHHGLHGAMVKALDLQTGTWAVRYAQDQESGAAPPGADALIMGQVVAAYDTAARRLILILTNAGDLEQTGETWAFDPAEGTWEQGAPVPNALPGGYPAGWATAFDPRQGRTVLFADTAVLGYDAAADTWTTVERGPGWPTGCTVAGVAVDPTARVGHQMVYDPTSGRMIVLGGSVRPVGEPPGGLTTDEEAPAADDVWAYRLASSTWTQLLAPSATAPGAQPTSRPGP